MQKKPYVIAIAGGTCSGKSTLTDRLEESLQKGYQVKVVHMDTYFKENPPNTVAPISRKVYVEHNHPDALDLGRLEQSYMEACHGGSDFVLVEGLFALHLDFIREAADLMVFVDLKSDERLARRIKRHIQFGQNLEEITERYLDTVRFRHDELIEPSRWHADIVVNGDLDKNKAQEVLEAYIASV